MCAFWTTERKDAERNDESRKGSAFAHQSERLRRPDEKKRVRRRRTLFCCCGRAKPLYPFVWLFSTLSRLCESKTGDYNDSNSIFEIRTYTLQLGYNPIPKMQNLYAEGLPSKIASDEEKLSELIWIGYADVGDLNKFVEIWKYPSYQSHIKVREAARTANAWRDTIGKIAPMVTHFNTTLCSAAPFSPVR